MRKINKTTYIKQFEKWGNKKKALNDIKISDSFYFLEREIWWASVGVNIGKEIDGKHENFERPIIIIKKISSDTFIALPISSQSGKRPGYTMMHNNQVRYVLIEQIRYMSINRLQRLISRMNEFEFNEIKKIIIKLIY